MNPQWHPGRNPVGTRQRGAVLVVGLLLLLIMTILGLASMGDTILQERMAANKRQTHLAIESAEAALRDAENWLVSQAPVTSVFLQRFISAAAGDEHLYSLAVDPGVNAPVFVLQSEAAWLDTATPVATPIPVAIKDQNAALARQPRYMIEYVGRVGPRAPTLGAPQPDTRPYAFRVTSMGWGADGIAHHMVRSSVRVN